jgi:hypothetical protein
LHLAGHIGRRGSTAEFLAHKIPEKRFELLIGRMFTIIESRKRHGADGLMLAVVRICIVSRKSQPTSR